ncbi:MAG: type II CRISPR RNA-guided endonuclease Cas9 [Xanthomarina sp.]|uniref:type II CRISPR RNA-guided endonuclease Cas9 n=1 Tax=Xanthomarina sp. TaxID=1931211 RepID=UPI000C3D6569|nr:type II CRISPR RNA-guided endonuclease Cas9 [Xanthomarina sp.]MAL21651.1 type II CRISPR RNA-guided endonuclease Cas9 [Xanthomarina sp.]MBF61224.1 type II CRISPR RNA-guided endonuclease Cas9 [Xanthomarina sp.]
MSKVLGLDLGTNSIGWALLDLRDEENKLEGKGVLIFSEGVKKEKGQEKSKAAERTGFRSARRIKFRRKIRKYQTLLVLAKHDMCPLTIEEVKEWRKSNFKKYPAKPEFLEWLRTDEEQNINPYYYRDKASREKISKYNLGRALYHIAQRRGFLSNRLDQSDDNLIKSKKDEIQDIINNTSLNKVDLIDAIEAIFETYEFKEKKKKDCTNATEEKLWSIRKYILNVIENKIKGKDYSKNEDVRKEIDRYINKPENLGAVQGNISELNTAISEANCKTLGQYFWKLYQQDRNDAKNKIRNNYTSREDHYLHEFEVICKTQGLDSINEAKKDPSERYSGIVKELYKAIFYQRPLKSQKGLIGKCSLEPNRVRCTVSRPEYELFRMYSFINTIKLKEPTAEKFRFLNSEERESIKSKFFRKSKPTFTFIDIKKTLGEDNKYNYKDNSTVSGCPTVSALISVFGDDWENIIYENYTDKIIRNLKNDKSEEVKSKEDVTADVWHVLSTFTSDEKLVDFAKNKLQLSQKDAEKFSKIHLKKDYASLSLYAIKKILPYLEKGLLYSHAVFMANMDKIIKPERWENNEDRELIEKEVGEIINNHQEENKMLFAVNSALKICFDNHQTYSKEAETGYKDDVEKQLKKEFGEKTWDNKPNKEALFSEAFDIFIQHLKERKHPAIKRIDEKVMEFLSDNDLLIPNTFNKLYHPSDIEKFRSVKLKDKDGNVIKIDGKEAIGLGSPDVGSIKNPMAMKALHQLKKLINTLILEGQIDENTKVNIELSRQLNDANKRKAIEKWQNDRKELFQEYEKKIKELYKIETGNELKEVTNEDIEKFTYALEQRKDKKLVSKEDVMKYVLWEEQNHICIYTGKTISLSSFLGANPQFDIEHTLPRSRSWDNSQMNKTLCDKTYNQQTKKERMPIELSEKDYSEILPRIQHWKDKYEALANEIEKKKRSTRGATDKEQKDKLIQQRHYLQMEYNYWKGKYDRFVMKEIKEGFKNSQAVDIGIISKYATAYLKSVFKKVYSVKGEMVSEYRKAWGLHDTFKDKWGRTQYQPKDRSNHIHHCIDAVTIACMNKNKYDKLAHAWGLEDKGEFDKAKKELENEKPWDTFTQDVRNLENEVFIVHQNKDVLPIQTKKKFRKRGKAQPKVIYKKDENGKYVFDTNGKKIVEKYIYKKDDLGNLIPVKGKKLNTDLIKDKKEGEDYFKIESENGTKFYEYLKDKENKIVYQKDYMIEQGDGTRGSLHKLNYIGVIAKPELENGKPKTENGAFILQKDDEGKVSKFYVKRNPVTKDFSESDVKKIVDEGIKRRIEKHGLKNVKTPDGFILLPAEKKGLNGSEKDLKEMLIKKIRLFEKDKPIEIKKQNEINLQTEKALRKKHKHHFYAQNDENYSMAIYEGFDKKGKPKRDFELVNNIDAGEYYKLSNKSHRENHDLVPNPHLKSSLPLKYILKKGMMVLMYDKDPDEIWELSDNQKLGRLYEITQLDVEKYAEIKLLHHQEAREKKEITKFMGLKTGMKGGKNLDNYRKFPWIKIGYTTFDCIVENIDFKILPTGKIEKI